MQMATGTRGEKVQESKTDVARQESTSKNSEIERYRSQIKQLEEILSQFGDAQTLISSLTGELQITSSTAEECDRSLLKLYSSLKTVQDQEVRELIMAKENEREILVVKLTVAESWVEKMQTQMLCWPTRGWKTMPGWWNAGPGGEEGGMSSCCIPWSCSCQPLCRNYCSQLAQCGTFRIKVLSEHARVEERDHQWGNVIHHFNWWW